MTKNVKYQYDNTKSNVPASLYVRDEHATLKKKRSKRKGSPCLIIEIHKCIPLFRPIWNLQEHI